MGSTVIGRFRLVILFLSGHFSPTWRQLFTNVAPLAVILSNYHWFYLYRDKVRWPKGKMETIMRTCRTYNVNSFIAAMRILIDLRQWYKKIKGKRGYYYFIRFFREFIALRLSENHFCNLMFKTGKREILLNVFCKKCLLLYSIMEEIY